MSTTTSTNVSALVLALCALLTGCASNDFRLAADLDGGLGAMDRRPPSGPRDECGNGADDDGDGLIDDGCPCGPGETQSCFGGPVAKRNRGACADGIQTCEPGLEWGDWGNSPCAGDTQPSGERCDGE